MYSLIIMMQHSGWFSCSKTSHFKAWKRTSSYGQNVEI